MMFSFGEQTCRGQCKERAGGGVQVREGLHPLAHCLLAGYLNNDGLSWLLAVEETFYVKFWRQRILLHRRANLLPFAPYDHIRVSSWGEKSEFLLCCSFCSSSEPSSRGVMQQFSSIPHQRRWISVKQFTIPQMLPMNLI